LISLNLSLSRVEGDLGGNQSLICASVAITFGLKNFNDQIQWSIINDQIQWARAKK
jgi:hypothetical protein